MNVIGFIKRNLVLFVVIGAFASVFLVSGLLGLFNGTNSNDSITISRFDANVVVNTDGSIDVREVWNMNYEAGYTVRFRDIDFALLEDYYPEELNVYTIQNLPTFDETAVKATIFKNSLNISELIDIGYSTNGDYDELGYLVDCEPHSTFCESIFTGFNSQFRLQDDVKFVYEYTIDNAVVHFSDISDLNWSLFGFVENNIEAGSITIELPTNMASATDFNTFSHIQNSEITQMSNSEVKINFENLDKDSKASFRLLMPTSYFTSPTVTGSVNWETSLIDLENSLQDKFVKQEFVESNYKFTPYILVGVMALITYALYLVVYRDKKIKTDGDITYPPMNLSPAIVSYLLNKGLFKKEVITATLLDLCRRDFVEIIDTDKEDDEVVFLIKHDLKIDELMGHEQALMHWLFGKDLSIYKVSSLTLEERARTATDVSDFYNNYIILTNI